ncbi:MAG TPA: hypothetical protein VNM69_00560 [Bacillus sp. (in: firmicutes)]|uniref:hypothetical protein n=1 Tax=Bacillus litorisediminis TaxID=2922713 RepID=UPI001FABBD82|nr:hypothetical protein [Bacillus litorisediminis]HWO74386.1 hypothetical protein [Bacillus sp. (in: firmicutes)]
MANKSHQLLNGWTLIAHNSYRLFSNSNSYVVLDHDNDVALQCAVTEQDFEVISSSWNLKFKIIPAFKTVKILNVPDEE